MSDAFDRASTVGHEVRPIARNQLDGAVANLDDPDAIGVGVAVHDTRTRTKKVRGLLRPVERPLGRASEPAPA